MIGAHSSVPPIPETPQIFHRSGRPFRSFDLLWQWLFDDTLRASLKVPGLPEWPFDAMMPTSPLHLRSTLSSAFQRNASLARSASPSLERLAPAPPPRKLSKGLERVFRRKFAPTDWQIGLLEGDPFDDSCSTKIVPILERPGTLRADPIGVRHDGVDWILFEEQLPGDRGRLRAAKRMAGSWCVQDGELLDLPHHLSWPSVVSVENRLFMLPETGEANEVAIWECETFPMTWKKRKVLLDGRHWHDPSLVKIGELWWLFVSAGGDYPQDHSAELHAFWSPNPLERAFVPHDLNPLSVSVAGSRPAGTPFQRDGHWIRPTQDCRAGYGTGILLRQLEELTPSHWQERVVGSLLPPKGMHGLHTLNHLPGVGWIVDYL